MMIIFYFLLYIHLISDGRKRLFYPAHSELVFANSFRAHHHFCFVFVLADVLLYHAFCFNKYLGAQRRTATAYAPRHILTTRNISINNGTYKNCQIDRV